MIRTRPLGIGTALLAAGCLTGAQTMEQDLALQRWKRCDTFSTIVSGRGPEDNAFLSCMADQAREQRRSKPDLVVPEPIFSPLLR